MFTCKRLKNVHINSFKNLNEGRAFFNNLNEDFFCLYDKINVIDRLLIMKNIVLLQDKKTLNYVGYSWLCKFNRYSHKIRSLSIVEEYKDNIEAYSLLLSALRENSSATYLCEKNSYNYNVLETLGFEKYNGALEMKRELSAPIYIDMPNNVSIEKLAIDKQEFLRCMIQNLIFQNNDRIPLTIEDIAFEKKQDYFYEDGCFFLKLNNIYIGYGQIIFEEEDTFCIVNFGIIPQYRGYGYSKCFLAFLLNYLYNMGHKQVKIKVSPENKKALNLYKSMGFVIEKEIYKWKLIR